MIFAEKIIMLRKQNGWSQEDLAARMNVSRQSVSKWEGAQSVPDLEKILRLSELFEVSTDYLLKDEMELDQSETVQESGEPGISLQMANEYLVLRRRAALPMAVGVVLCILSPVMLLVLGAVSELPHARLSEDGAAMIGLGVLVVMIAAAVAVFMNIAAQHKPYKFLDEELFEMEYGVAGFVRQQEQAFAREYSRGNIMGVILCILSPLVLFVGAFTNNEFYAVLGFCGTLVMVAAAVGIFILVGVPHASMERLLQQGEFTKERKAVSRLKETIAGIYWLVTTAIYLGWSFASNDWDHTWIIWPVAAVLFGALMGIVNLVHRRD